MEGSWVKMIGPGPGTLCGTVSEQMFIHKKLRLVIIYLYCSILVASMSVICLQFEEFGG